MGVGTAQQNDSEGIVFENQVTDGQSVTVESATLSEGGFVGIVDTNGFLIGVSEHLPAGDHSNVEVTLDDPLDEGAELDTDLEAVALVDENDNQQYDGSTDPHDQLMLGADDRPVSDTAIVVVEDQSAGEPVGEANFQIQSVNATSSAADQSATVTADIENVGNATGTQNVSYTLEGGNITTGAGAVDIVFVLDQSGSMDDDNAVVRQELQNFTAQLESENVDARYAVIEMERPASTLQNFSSNVTETQASIEEVLQATGETEDNFDALNQSLNLLESESRPNAQQIVIDITDEGSNTAEPTQADLADRFDETNTSYIAVTPGPTQDPMAEYPTELQKQPLANMTEDGVWYDLLEDEFGEQFTEEIAGTVIDVSRQNQQELTLDTGETDSVTFQVNTSDIPPESYTVTVETEDDTATTTLTVDSS
jgi:Mg-chelatase subunit ChlD